MSALPRCALPYPHLRENSKGRSKIPVLLLLVAGSGGRVCLSTTRRGHRVRPSYGRCPSTTARRVSLSGVTGPGWVVGAGPGPCFGVSFVTAPPDDQRFDLLTFDLLSLDGSASLACTHSCAIPPIKRPLKRCLKRCLKWSTVGWILVLLLAADFDLPVGDSLGDRCSEIHVDYSSGDSCTPQRKVDF